jgi:kynureninase
MARSVGDRIGALIGAPTGSVSMHPNVTSAEMVVLSCFRPEGRRDTIVVVEPDFPSVLYLYRAHEELGFRLVVVPGERDLTVRTERILDAIDERTLLVAFSHVLFRNSYVMDVAEVVERAHLAGARVVLDVYQSAGIVPLDVRALDVDFATGGCLKWLCGGPGNAFLYTRPDLLRELQPRFTGWVAHHDPFAFDPGPVERRTDALRMMSGTPTIPAFYAARAGLEIIAATGVDRIREKSRRMTAHLTAEADARGWQTTVSRDPERVAGTTAVDVPEARHVARTLKARDFVVDYRVGAGIRISPHFYNTFDELDRIVGEIERIVRTRDYDVSRPFSSLVT